MKRFSLVGRPQANRRRAAVAALTAVTLVVLLIFASFAVDLGFVRAVCGDMQHTADSGALAGASALREDGQEPASAAASAHDRALDVIERMQKSQGFEALADQIIEVGTWDFKTRAFTAADATTKGPFAVRVVGVRNNTPLFFAAVMGKYSTDVTREAVAIGSRSCGGIWGLEGIAAGSISTDSFDSSIASYSSTTANNNGDLCSGRGIVVEGSFEIHGDVMNGFGYELLVNGTSGEITGLTTSNMNGVKHPPVDFGDIRSFNDNGTIGLTDGGRSPWTKTGKGIRIAANDNLGIGGGRYYFDSIALTGGATITLGGPSTFYVSGSIDAAGGSFLNIGGDPSTLSIISSGTSVKLAGGTDFAGSLLAPYAQVSLLGNMVFSGALVGKTLVLDGDTQIHVDESLPLSKWYDPPFPSLVR